MDSYSKIWLVTIDTLFFHFNYDSFTAFLKKNKWDWQIKFYLFDHKHFTCVSIKLYNMLYSVCLWSELWIFQAVEKHIFRRTSLWGILWGNSLKYLWMRTHTHKTANFHLIFLPILFQVSKKKLLKDTKFIQKSLIRHKWAIYIMRSHSVVQVRKLKKFYISDYSALGFRLLCHISILTTGGSGK